MVAQGTGDRGQADLGPVLALLLIFAVTSSPSLFSLPWFGVVMVPPSSTSQHTGCGGLQADPTRQKVNRTSSNFLSLNRGYGFTNILLNWLAASKP